MKRISKLKTEILLSILILVSMILAVNPMEFGMPMLLELCILTLFAAGVFAFVTLIWKEKPRDEREQLLALEAGKLSYFVGAVILTIGIIFESIQDHEVNEWLVISLGAMVITKIVTSVYNKMKE